MDLDEYPKLLYPTLYRKKDLIRSWAKRLEKSGIPENKVSTTMGRTLADLGVPRILIKHIYNFLDMKYKRKYNRT